MSYKKIKQLPDISQVVNRLPLSLNHIININKHNNDIKSILNGTDNRLLLIVGPCSAWPYEASIEYAKQLMALQIQVQSKIKLVMRVYTQKPRTTIGWGGAWIQPELDSAPDIKGGIYYTRKLMYEISSIGLAIATEILYLDYYQTYLDLISWAAIGARSAENQEHRIFASMLDIAVGIKNPTTGLTTIGINSILSAQQQHTAIIDNYQIETSGNLYAHLVLRGGNNQSNYHDLTKLYQSLIVNNISNPAIIIDVSHDNSIIDGKKQFEAQGDILLNILQMQDFNNNYIKGFMLESFLLGGCQSIKKNDILNLNGLSITDPCLDFIATQELILKLYSSR